MWNDDGDWETYRNKDEDNWDNLRTEKVSSIADLFYLLETLGVRIYQDEYSLSEFEDYVDRHWKV
jgi:predicted helicase